ncbi:hypothetical protein Q3C01_18455 [Bradyrhizobium sp. UFLA05-109]
MPRFFFHAHGGISVFDDIGLELPDVAAAQLVAIEVCRNILNEGPEGPFWEDLNWRIEVTDGPGICGQTFLVVQFSVTRTAIIPNASASGSLGSR